MLNAVHPGNALIGSGGVRLPLGCHLGQLDRLLRRSHIGFERGDHLDLALALHVR